jgi:hypothetical protein
MVVGTMDPSEATRGLEALTLNILDVSTASAVFSQYMYYTMTRTAYALAVLFFLLVSPGLVEAIGARTGFGLDGSNLLLMYAALGITMHAIIFLLVVKRVLRVGVQRGWGGIAGETIAKK